MAIAEDRHPYMGHKLKNFPYSKIQPSLTSELSPKINMFVINTENRSYPISYVAENRLTLKLFNFV